MKTYEIVLIKKSNNKEIKKVITTDKSPVQIGLSYKKNYSVISILIQKKSIS